MGAYAIKETKEMLDLVLGIEDAAVKSYADGKINEADLQFVLPIIPLIQPAFDKKEEIPKVLGDVDVPEAGELIAHIGTKLAISDAKAKIKVAYGLKMVQKLFLIYIDVKDMQAELAKAV